MTAEFLFLKAETIQTLLLKLKIRQRFQMVPAKAREILNTRSVQQKSQILSHIDDFYETTIDYFKKWSVALDGTEKFSWMSLRRPLAWNDIQGSLEFIKCKFGPHALKIFNGEFEIQSSKIVT